jgi:hypothetical protein
MRAKPESVQQGFISVANQALDILFDFPSLQLSSHRQTLPN